MINKGDGEEYYYPGLDNKSKYVHDRMGLSKKTLRS